MDSPLLLELGRRHLPLPLERLAANISEQEGDAASYLILAHEYERVAHMPAYQHLMGKITRIQTDLARTILSGKFDDFGIDRTPYFRAAFALSQQIMAIPATVALHAQTMEQSAGLTAPANLTTPEAAPTFER